MIPRFEWTNARSIDDAIDQISSKALVKAGGVDLMDRLKEGLDAPSRLVNIRTIAGLDDVKEESGWLRIGPMVTLAAIAEHPLIRKRYTVLADAALNAATPQIRNMATVGGNLLQRPRCWYFRNEQFHCRRKGGEECFAQDGENEYHAIFDNEICAVVHPSAAACALTALGAKVGVKGKKGAREISLDELFVRPETDVTREHVLQPGELLTEIRVPAPSDATRSAYTKVGQKESFDWPLSEVAVVLETRGGAVSKAAIVLGAAAPVPWRASAAEKALTGKPLNEQSAREAATAAMQGATPLSQNAYKIPMFEAVVRRTILAAGQEA
ncbi:MAG TPA: xanthine dehydrogenase family protein subunit M [Candidatus Sulfotelmatobacter sp.]|nr:xanthine dehydrogenase family protein subunit M [Candidatus Sulfotelmatobacter sp.]